MTEENNPIQTRSKTGELRYFASIHGAMQYAKSHEDVWKISWTNDATGERVRLVAKLMSYVGIEWVYEPIITKEIADIHEGRHDPETCLHCNPSPKE